MRITPRPPPQPPMPTSRSIDSGVDGFWEASTRSAYTPEAHRDRLSDSAVSTTGRKMRNATQSDDNHDRSSNTHLVELSLSSRGTFCEPLCSRSTQRELLVPSFCGNQGVIGVARFQTSLRVWKRLNCCRCVACENAQQRRYVCTIA